MNDKPKDRITMWMSIIAYILVLMIAFALGVMMIVTFDDIGPIVYLLYPLFLVIVLRWIMREKRNYKPKDRTTMRMSIIALVLVLISALGVMIYSIVTGDREATGAVFALLFLVFLAIALHHLRHKMSKGWFAFFLGLFSFFLYMFIGESFSDYYGENVGLAAAFILVAAYFFVCQFFLSRGNPNAFPKDWPIMLALDAVLLFCLIPMALLETQEVVLAQGSVILLSCCGGTLAGAFVASKAARRKAGRQ